MQNFSRRFLQVAVLTFTTIVLAGSASAAAFSKASVKGSYSFENILWTANPTTPAFGMLGVMTFDGVGHVTASYNSITGGALKTGTWGGTYTVNSDGVGAIDITTGATARFALTLNSTVAGVAHGLQLLLTDDANNEVVSGAAVLQSAAAQTYSAASLKGTFAIQGDSWTAKAGDKREGLTGIVNFDGKGGLTSFVKVMWGGAFYAGKAESGSYTVGPNGIGNLILSGGAHQAFALNSVLSGLANGLQILVTVSSDLDKGSLVLSGTALKQ